MDAKFPSDTFGKVEDEVGRGNAFERLPTDALDDALELDQRAATDQVLLPSVYKVPGRVGNRRRFCGVQLSERHSRG